MKILRIPWVIILVVAAGRAFSANAQTGTNLHSFAGYPSDGSTPIAGLVQGIDGNFYGTTYEGGTSANCGGFGCGTVFRISPSGSYTILHSFAGPPSDGQNPEAGLVQGTDTNFYGTTHFGGTNNLGTVFRISPSGSYTSLYSFGSSPGDGLNPEAGLVQGVDSNFYGTTSAGGARGNGTVFRISTNGTYASLYSFVGWPNDGGVPQAGLVQGTDSNFYGTTSAGGTNNNCGDAGCGTVFRISTNGTYLSLYSFAGRPNDGQNPEAGLVQGVDSNFYGTTYFGGTSSSCGDTGCGMAFRISPSGTNYAVLYSFGSFPSDGQDPDAALIQGQGSDSNFYGTTAYGGKFDNGTVFRISPSGSYSNLYSFGSSPNDGRIPQAALVQGANSNFYGTTAYGGANNEGAVFELGSSSNCTCTLTPTSVKVSIKGGSRNVRVKTTGIGCSWTASTTNDWITITSGSSGTGNGKVVYAVPGNTNPTPLSGMITIADQTFTVNQVAGGCTFSLSPKRRRFKAVGGFGTVKVKPNLSDCTWSAAVNSNSFITITAGTNGVGKGTVSYTVPANTNTTPLYGTMTIAGKLFTVTQSGEK
jgi:uncharacterized repeat protein (TIGR03803 family)